MGLIIGTQIVGRVSRYSERTFLKSGLILSISAALLVHAILMHTPLLAVAIPIFLFVMSLSIIDTSSFSLTMETKGNVAGSASALLGLLPFLLESLTAPLVGIGGEETALPMGITIFVASSLLASLSYFMLVRKGSVKVNAAEDVTNQH
ncbi:Bcr/CflA subfamily drug resistance transporter [Mycobacteroides abscessus subsp. abscessus]|nr:Bcr/CflA subfamily drug resistance transporter [Mycobacteroides abscessus subsp. abscessus]